ncbi:MAG: TonB-dependent receptor [Candidatus Kapaibacterium sp.]|nr:MAG: TonB-dependent receptor [Candidatus Kapabacteria bacterium]
MNRFLLLLFVLVLASSHSLMFAQNSSSLVIKGVVKSASGEALPSAKITLLNSPRGTLSAQDGSFALAVPSAGKYTFTVSRFGFAKQERRVEVKSGDAATLEITLPEESLSLEQITVTAERREENSQKSPVAVTSISAKQIENFRLWSSNDLTALAPNLTVTKTSGGPALLTVRGVNAYSYNPAVAMYIDDVAQFDADAAAMTLMDIERIEVLRGPQGTLFGRNALGGVVNITTKRPTNLTSGSAELSYGSRNQARAAVAFKTPLVQDRLFFGASGVYERGDGYYFNEFTKQPTGRFETVGGNIFLKWLPSDEWVITLNAKGETNYNEGQLYATNDSIARANPFRLNMNRNGSAPRDVVTGSLTVQHYGEGLNFTSITSYQGQQRRYIDTSDIDYSPLDFQGFTAAGSIVPVQTLMQELRFSSPDNVASPLRWIAGAYGFLTSKREDYTYVFGKDLRLAGDTLAPYNTATYSTTRSWGFALFGQASYTLWDALTFTAGLRYDYESNLLTTRSELIKQPFPPVPTLTQRDVNGLSTAFSPKISVAYQFDDSKSMYASYTRGFRPGGVNGNANEAQFLTYKPEYSDNYEIGFKSQFFDNRLRANITAFLINRTDVQINSVTPQFSFAIQNIGETRASGVELELSAILLPGLQLDWNAGYINSAYTRLPYLDASFRPREFAGNLTVYTPDITSMLALQYNVPLGVNIAGQPLTLVARGEWRYTGRQYFDVINTIPQAAYSLVNTRVGVSTPVLDVFVWGRNLTDARYLQYAYPFFLRAGFLGEPISLGVQVLARF